ncbi:MAG TPA: hypothetical protein VJL54_00810, partial [Nitrososphaera sp.]|nr:hypothetical protein [Nitrososphaera sp.]
MGSRIGNGSRTLRTSRNRWGNYWFSYLWLPPCEGNLFQFFIKPHLRIEGLTKVKILLPYVWDGEKKHLEGVLWNLKVTNKHRRIASSVQNCTGILYLRKFGKEVAMGWYEEHRSIDFNQRDVKQGDWSLGTHFASEIMQHSSTTEDIPAGESKQLYFLLTIPNFNDAFIVIDHTRVYFDEKFRSFMLNGIPLLLPKGMFDFIVRFNDEKRGHHHRIRINSYD